MPSRDPLSDQARADLIAYVKSFSDHWKTEKSETPIEIPAEPEGTAERIKVGQEVFRSLIAGSATASKGALTGLRPTP